MRQDDCITTEGRRSFSIYIKYMLDDRTFGKEEFGKYHPDYEDYSELETLVENGELEAFDYIISNAVLNVVPQDTRDNLTVAMGHLLKPGGQMFVNVISKGYNGAVNSNPERVQARSTNGELKYDKKGNPVYVGSVRTQEGDYSEGGNTVGRGHETFVWGSNSVQKVFSTNELIGYLQDALGNGYKITKDSLGMTGVTVTKKGGNGAQYQARTNLSVEANKFSNTVDKWFNNGKKDGEVFSLGSTGSVIQGLGAIESDVYMLSDKINKIMEDHPEISIKEIKNIPEILESPVFILESKNAWGAKENTRITIFGMVKAQNNKPVMVVFDLNPEENNITLYDMQKVTSVYTKNKRENSTINLIRSSNIMYIDKQKATMLLHSVDFQHVYSVEQSGYVGRITYSGNIVNVSGKKFDDVFSYNGINGKDSEGRELTAEQHDYLLNINTDGLTMMGKTNGSAGILICKIKITPYGKQHYILQMPIMVRNICMIFSQ